MRVSATCFFMALMWLLAAAFASAQDGESAEKISQANQACLSCHSPVGFAQLAPRENLNRTQLAKLLLDPSHFNESNHTGIACTQCHSNAVSEFPHQADARQKISVCEDCHASKTLRIEKQIADSVHGVQLVEPFTCLSCHNPHRGAIASRIKDAKKVALQDNKICLDCHLSERAMARVSGNNSPRLALDAAHAWLPNTQLHWGAVRCLECHTESDKKPHMIVNGDKAEHNCTSCHSADSMLKTRLYRHQALEAQEKLGFLNSAVLSSAYVVGATRHPWLDRIVIALAILTVAGVCAHGALRIIAALWRRKKRRAGQGEQHD